MLLIRPLDQRLARAAVEPLSHERLRSLRYFWLDGLFSSISDNFFISYIPLFALAYGANNGQIGWLTAAGNFLGALALFPGARLVEWIGQRKSLALWSGGILARVALLGLAAIPFLIAQPGPAIFLIVLLNGLRALTSNLANPAWTSIVADLVPDFMRGRYFSSRNMAIGAAALVVAPLAGRIISVGNGWFEQPFFGYQMAFFLAFAAGMVGVLSFQRVHEPPARAETTRRHQRGALREALRRNPAFVGLIASAFIWNLSLQLAGPFFNVYLVSEFGATAGTVGLLASISSFSALFGQQLFGRLLDRKGALWVQQRTGFMIPLLPFAWVFITAPWQVGLVNLLGGVLWAGYSLSDFNLLLQLTPDEQRPRAVALYQTAVFASAVLGPLLGGYLADNVHFKLVFGLSSAGRLAGMLLFVSLTVRQLRRREEQAPVR